MTGVFWLGNEGFEVSLILVATTLFSYPYFTAELGMDVWSGKNHNIMEVLDSHFHLG